jgi:hypothetical protein
MWCVLECDQVKIKNLDTYFEQGGRRGKDYKTKNLQQVTIIMPWEKSLTYIA